MKRPEYLADEVPKMAAELVRLREVERAATGLLTRWNRRQSDSHPMKDYAWDALRSALALPKTALAPRSERREGEPHIEDCVTVACVHGVAICLDCAAEDYDDPPDCAPPAAPKEEAK